MDAQGDASSVHSSSAQELSTVKRIYEAQIESLREEHRNKTQQLEESLRAAREQAVQNAVRSAREQSEQHVSLVEQSLTSREAELLSLKSEVKRLQDHVASVRESAEREERARTQAQVCLLLSCLFFRCAFMCMTKSRRRKARVFVLTSLAAKLLSPPPLPPLSCYSCLGE
jgi:hypothetical protein